MATNEDNIKACMEVSKDLMQVIVDHTDKWEKDKDITNGECMARVMLIVAMFAGDLVSAISAGADDPKEAIKKSADILYKQVVEMAGARHDEFDAQGGVEHLIKSLIN